MQIAVSERLPRFEPGVFLFHADAFSQRPFSAAIFPAGSGIFLKKESQRFGRRFVGPDGLRKRRPFSFQKGRWLQRLKRQAGEDLSGLIFLQQEDRSHGHPKHKPSASLP